MRPQGKKERKKRRTIPQKKDEQRLMLDIHAFSLCKRFNLYNLLIPRLTKKKVG